MPETGAEGNRRPGASFALCGGLTVLAVLLSGCNPSTIPAGESLAIPVESRVIADLGGSPSLAPGLSFVGGLELTSSEDLFGAFSSIRFTSPERFLGVFDTGFWISGLIERDPQGRLAAVRDVALAPLLGPDGQESPRKSQADAESLAIAGDRAYVGFEQRHRVVAYAPLSTVVSALPSEPLAMPFDLRQLRSNGGLETLAPAPAESALSGALIAISEKTVDENGHLIAGIVGGPLAGEFRLVRHDGFDVTDGVFLPGGDLLLLERRFTIATGVAMRLRRIVGDSIKPGAVVDGEILLTADNGSQIDNMEGLDAIPAEDGSVRLILVSDDNHSILQRSLMLEFRLAR